MNERCRYGSFDTFSGVYERIEVGRVRGKIKQVDLRAQGKLLNYVRMMGPEIVQDYQEVLTRILVPGPAKKETDILIQECSRKSSIKGAYTGIASRKFVHHLVNHGE